MNERIDSIPKFSVGEWVLSGFNNHQGIAVIELSPGWKLIPIERRLWLLQSWIDALSSEYDALVQQEPDKNPPPE